MDGELPMTEAGTDVVPMDQAELPPAEMQAMGEDPAAYPTGDPQADPAQAAAVPVQGSGEYENYTVNSGDTLMKIAFEVYGDLYQWRRIYELNRDRVTDPNQLVRGAQLKVERPASAVHIDRNGEQYLIKTGDTLGTISGDIYGTPAKWKKLWENNRQLIKDPNKIFAGFTLYYVLTPEERSASPLANGSGSGQRAPSSTPAGVNGSTPMPAGN